MVVLQNAPENKQSVIPESHFQMYLCRYTYEKAWHACFMLTYNLLLQWHTEGTDLYEKHMRNALWMIDQWVYVTTHQLYILYFVFPHSLPSIFICYGRVHIRGQLEQWKGEAPSADQRTITIAVDMNMMEDRAFSQTEGGHGITMTTSGDTMEKMCISLVNAELVHPREGWEHCWFAFSELDLYSFMFLAFLTLCRKTILIEDPGKTLTQDGPWSLGKRPLQIKVSILMRHHLVITTCTHDSILIEDKAFHLFIKPSKNVSLRARAPPPHSVRGQGIYPAPRSLPESGEDTLVQAILNLDRGYEITRGPLLDWSLQLSLNMWQRKGQSGF